METRKLRERWEADAMALRVASRPSFHLILLALRLILV